MGGVCWEFWYYYVDICIEFVVLGEFGDRVGFVVFVSFVGVLVDWVMVVC